VDDVIARVTWNPAREIQQQQLGNLSVGSPADISVLRLQQGDFGFTDMYGTRLPGHQKFICELTLKNGKAVYNLNGLGYPAWDQIPGNYKYQQDPRWDATGPPSKEP
jgi:dihydroorotase